MSSLCVFLANFQRTLIVSNFLIILNQCLELTTHSMAIRVKDMLKFTYYTVLNSYAYGQGQNYLGNIFFHYSDHNLDQ